jgi:SOS-response transcriptional repressor LexA
VTGSSNHYQAAAAEVMQTLWDVMPMDEGELEQASQDLYRQACELCKAQSFENAITCCGMALRLARETCDSRDTASNQYAEGLGQALLGATYLHQCEVNTAIEHFQKATDEFRGSNRHRSESVAWMAIGEGHALQMGEKEENGNVTPRDCEQALSAFQRSLNTIERLRATDETIIRLKMRVGNRMKEIHRSFAETLAKNAPSLAASRAEGPASGQPETTQPTEKPQPDMSPSKPGGRGLKQVPIVAIVRAGPGRLAEQKELGSLSLDPDLARSITHAVDIEGLSMIGDGIYPGDFVLVHAQENLDHGELGVFLITYAGELTETTLKHFHPEADHVCLKPMNEAEPIMVIIPHQEDASRIIKQYEQQGCTVRPYVNADVEIVAKAHGLFRLFDRVRPRGHSS